MADVLCCAFGLANAVDEEDGGGCQLWAVTSIGVETPTIGLVNVPMCGACARITRLRQGHVDLALNDRLPPLAI